MERRQIRELIGRFLHNDVPGELQTQFRRWMLQPGDGDEKEAALREEWTAVVESPAAADRSEELQRLRHTIRMREAQQRRSRIFRRIRYARPQPPCCCSPSANITTYARRRPFRPKYAC